jgi:general nucleoside transport system permease protein
MTEKSENNNNSPPGIPGLFAPIARVWIRVSPRLVPVLAIITAFLVGVPIMLLTGGGLETATNGYTALVEGVTGLAVNDVADTGNFSVVAQYADYTTIESGSLSRQANPFFTADDVGIPQLRNFDVFITEYDTLDEEQINNLAERLTVIRDVNTDTLRDMQDLLLVLDELPEIATDNFIQTFAGKDRVTSTEHDAAMMLWPDLMDISSKKMLLQIGLIDEYGFDALEDHVDALDDLHDLGIEPDGLSINILLEIRDGSATGLIYSRFMNLPFVDRSDLLDEDKLDGIAMSLPSILAIGEDTLDDLGNNLRTIKRLDKTALDDLIADIAGRNSLNDKQQLVAAIVWPALLDMDDAELETTLDYLKYVNKYGIRTLQRSYDALLELDALSIGYDSEDADTIIDLSEVGVENVIEAIETLVILDAAGIDQPGQLALELSILGKLYGPRQYPEFGLKYLDKIEDAETVVPEEFEGEPLKFLGGQIILIREGGQTDTVEAKAALALLEELDIAFDSEEADILVSIVNEESYLSAATVNEVLESELATVLDEHLIILRPDQNLVLVGDGQSGNLADVVYDSQELPVYYLNTGGRVFLFMPSLLEATIVNSIRFIIAGLAVALGFKAGLFNIGAEGQIYAGGVFAVWVGFSPIFAGFSIIFHIPLIIIAGIVGGMLWAAIPGALKAFTGAHEVITTIMMNLIAIRLVDWLIKSKNPILLGDPDATVPKTPSIADSARLPIFDAVPLMLFVVVGVLVASYLLWLRRDRLNGSTIIRPILGGSAIIVGGFFLTNITVRGNLHVGFLIMLAAVWLTDWFMERTTSGFELRTVGLNMHAAKYAGMNVPRNIILAMVLSGALAGLAGVIEVSGKQHNLLPGYFGGAGFDAIAVALIARTNPKSMIWAGLLWGGLLSGAGLMQIRAGISVDLVKIIQALIIMFISADQIVRFLYRVPKGDDKELVFSSGWGS